MGRAAVVALTVLALGCDGTTTVDLAWRVETMDPNADRWSMFILEGGCSDGATLWEQEYVGGTPTTSPPEMPPGRYGIGGFAWDSGCNLVGCGCQDWDVPLDASEIVTTLTAPCDFNMAPLCPGDEPPAGCGEPPEACVFEPSPSLDRSCEDGSYALGGDCFSRMVPIWPDAASCPDVRRDNEITVRCPASLADVQQAIDDIDMMGGGYVNLEEACRYEGTRPLVIRNDTPLVLSGAGRGTTVLATDCSTDCGGNAALVVDISDNVLLRDFTVESTRSDGLAMTITGRDGGPNIQNVRVRRVELISAGNGLLINESEDIVLTDVSISSEADGLIIRGDPERSAVSNFARRIALLDVAIVWNPDGGTQQTGLSASGVVNFEMAGGTIAGYANIAAEFLAARNAWMHHVSVVDSGPVVVRGCTATGPCRNQPHHSIAIHDNEFRNVASPMVEVREDDGAAYLLNNFLEGTATSVDYARSGAADVFVCPAVPGMDPGFAVTDCEGLVCTGNLFGP